MTPPDESLVAAVRADRVLIDTSHLRVRPFRPEDWRDLLEYLSMPEVYRFEPGAPIGEREARALAEERSRESFFHALELREQDRLIGHLSFLPVDPPHLLTRELGFIVSPSYQGHGYAAEGGRALVSHAFASLGVHRVIAECHPDNVASWWTLENIGFTREAHLRRNVFFRLDHDGRPCWQDTYVYALLNPADAS